MKDVVTELDMVNNTVVIENITGKTIDGVIVVAAYDENNQMLDCYMADTSTIKSGKSTVPFTFETADGASVYKAFVWNDMTNLEPLCKAAVSYK